MAVLGQDGFGVELHALDVEFGVAHAHDLAVLGPGRHLQTVGQALALGDQRMVAAHSHGLRRTGKHAPRVVLHGRDLAVHEAPGTHDFPAEHWKHLRTTNPIESTFATIRLRHRRTKGNGTRKATLTMLFKLAESASHHWRTLDAAKHLIEVAKDTKFQDGIILPKVAA